MLVARPGPPRGELAYYSGFMLVSWGYSYILTCPIWGKQLEVVGEAEYVVLCYVVDGAEVQTADIYILVYK